MVNVLNCPAFFFFLFKFESSGKSYLEAFNFSVFVDCSKIRKNLYRKQYLTVLNQYLNKKYFSHITDKSVSLRRNSLKALVIKSLLLLLFLLLFLLIVHLSALHSIFNDTHMEETCALLNSVKNFIEKQGWLLLTLFICLHN